MKRQLRFSDKAEKDLEEIYEYSCRAFSKRQAKKYVTQLYREIEKRVEDPESLSQKETDLTRYIDAPEGAIRSFLYERHRCYFTFDNAQLRVLMIIHGSRDQAAEFQRLAKLSSR